MPVQPDPSPVSPEAVPFVILTLRRTGGTSLMTFMSAISPFETLQHEPFNVERVWGPIVARFRETGDVAAMTAEVEAGLETRPNIKHCFEIIPLEVTRALIEGCVARGYRIFLLTRRGEADRVMSLAFARSTGVWGPEDAERIYPAILSGEVTPKELVVQEWLRQARADSARLGEVLRLLRHRRVAYEWLVFEEIYKGERPVEAVAAEIAACLGVPVVPDDSRLQVFRERSGQNSRMIAAHVPNAALVRQTLERMCIG